MHTDTTHKGLAQSLQCCVAATSILLSTSIFAQSGEGTLTGPNISGNYILLSTRGAARGAAPDALRIVQTARSFRVGWLKDGKEHWSTFPFSTEWIEDSKGGRAKAFFEGSGGALIAERYKETGAGRFSQLDRWTLLGPNTVRVCRSAYVTRSSSLPEEKFGCAVYSRQ